MSRTKQYTKHTGKTIKYAKLNKEIKKGAHHDKANINS